ncbi:hypothetical protein ACEPAG_664 [Sanghuangporus baumii]
MIAGLSKAVTLYLATILALTALFLTYFAFLAPVLLLEDRVSLLSITPSTSLQDNPSSSNDVDGPTLRIGALGSCSRSNHDEGLNCTQATLSPTYSQATFPAIRLFTDLLYSDPDLSDLPSNTSLLLTGPPSASPGFIAVSLGFSTIFVFLFSIISLRSKLGPKLGAALDKPFLNRAVAWLGLIGFMIGLTAFLVIRMWFGKAIDDFNSGIKSMGNDGPALVASAGNGFTSTFFLLLPVALVLAQLSSESVDTSKTLSDVSRNPSQANITSSSSSAQETHSFASNSLTTTHIPSVSNTLPTNNASGSPISAFSSISSLSFDEPTQTSSDFPFPPTSTQSPNSTNASDIDAILARRLEIIVASTTQATSISSWLSTLQEDGSWPASEIDYTTGCDAQRANWPAQNHWSRILAMASAFRGGLESVTERENDTELLSAISSAMDFWFSNDMASDNCVDSGGLETCPCGTPGFWNTNWFSNLLGIPDLVVRSCLLVTPSLTPDQFSNYTHISGRAYATVNRNVINLGIYTGANLLDMASIGIDLSLLTENSSLIGDAYTRVHNEVVIQEAVRTDGIKPDGSFSQHGGLIYNGNYGKDYSNAVIELEIAAAGTQFQAGETSREAFEALMDGDQWMIYLNVETGVLHWDFSAVGRMISFPVADDQATASIKMNITEIAALGDLWESSTLLDVYDKLEENSTTANVGSINGNRMFYSNDYMLHRGPGYISTLRMYSNRTTNTECLNSQNPFGFHLSDGTVYTHLTGSEYEDIAASWDWNLIPGTTVDYNATRLSCDNASFSGIESFVGGTSTGSIGLGAMRYTNPFTGSLHWQKAWFFLENNVQHVMLNNLSSETSTPVFSILDQRKRTSDITINGLTVDGGNFSQPTTLWHGNVGYTFPLNSSFALSVDSGPRTGNWTVLGISTQPLTTVDLFSAWLAHTDLDTGISYTTFPAVEYQDFLGQAATTLIVDVQNDPSISAVLDVVHSTAMIIFWEEKGGEVTIPPLSGGVAPISISSDRGLLVILEMQTWNLTIAEPTQTITDAEVSLQLQSGDAPEGWCGERTKSMSIVLPTGRLAGSSVSTTFF